MPEIYAEIERMAEFVQVDSEGVQDIEITWQSPEEIYLLQTRDAKISPRARISRALRQYHLGRMSKEELIKGIDVDDFSTIAVAMVDNKNKAMEYYNKILELDPKNEAALNGISKLQETVPALRTNGWHNSCGLRAQP